MASRQRVEFDGGWAEAALSFKPVRVGDRLLPPSIEVHFAGDPSQPSLGLRIETLPGGVPECRELRLTAAKAGRAVRTLDLRAVRIAEWVQDIAAMFAKQIIAEHDGEITTVTRATRADHLAAAQTLRQARTGRGARKLDRAYLKGVAAVYKSHIDDAPTQAVADSYGVTRAMASKYVRMCRDLHLLGETSPGKKGI